MLESKKTFLSPIEAAKVAQCSRRTIYRMIESNQLKAVKFGDSWKIDRQAFYKLLGIESPEIYAQTA